jgi:signal transduction histidine kinase
MNLPRFWTIGIVVLILAAVVNLGAMNAAERGFVELRNTADWVQHTQRVQNLIEHLLRLAVDAETGQRGYLISGRDSQLERYVEARNEIPVSLDELRTLTADNPVQVAQLVNVGTQLAARLDNLERGIALRRANDDPALAEYLAGRDGKIAMDALRLALDGMATEERKKHEERFAGAQDVLERTAEITALSHYLQRLQEDEKAHLAREIHDELGGTLAAAKIDLQMLMNKLPPDDLQRTRLVRAMAAIDDAVRVKRRIIEDLRPSVLDNLGIGAALKWQCLEFEKRLGVPCRVELHDDDLVLPSAPSIALYRVAQEALTNIGKYASAKNVIVSLRRDDGRWVLRVADDGIGLDPAKAEHPTGFGLLAMRERVRALGGDFSVSGRPGEGTVIQVRLPAGIAAAA